MFIAYCTHLLLSSNFQILYYLEILLLAQCLNLTFMLFFANLKNVLSLVEQDITIGKKGRNLFDIYINLDESLIILAFAYIHNKCMIFFIKGSITIRIFYLLMQILSIDLFIVFSLKI